MQLKNKLIELRKQNNFNQQELGDKLHVSRKTISSWENERTYPDIKTLIDISNLFNVSLDYLLTNDNKLVEEYVDRTKITTKNNKINSISYFVNIFLVITFHIGMIQPFKITIPFITLILMFNIIIWCITYRNWKKFKENKKIFWISFIIIFLIEFNLRLSIDRELINNLEQFFYDISYIGMVIGTFLKTILIVIGILISFFGYKKKKK